MKVLHVPFAYYPDPVGGTEAYVASLSREQRARGIQAVVAAPGVDRTSYVHEGVPVHRFGTSKTVRNLRLLYGEGDRSAAEECARILDAEAPDLLHMHALSPAVSILIVREATSRAIPVVFTYHTPTVSCQRGTLMRHGEAVCDGTLAARRCTSCTLHGLGGGRLGSAAFSLVPETVGQWLGQVGASGGLWTALRMRELVGLRTSTFHALMDEVTHVVALCSWSRDVLLRNGVAAQKISVSRHGLTELVTRRPRNRVEGRDLRLAFFGRLDPTKGVETVIRAFARFPALPARLHVYGIAQGDSGREYSKVLRGLTASDDRITFLDPIPAAETVARMADYDAVVVPSEWLETGPLVVLEAFAAGVPVVGSRLGGISELVSDGHNGVLVESGSPAAWADVFQRLCENPAELQKLRACVAPPRRMSDVANDMAGIYEKALGVRNRRVSRHDGITAIATAGLDREC